MPAARALGRCLLPPARSRPLRSWKACSLGGLAEPQARVPVPGSRPFPSAGPVHHTKSPWFLYATALHLLAWGKRGRSRARARARAQALRTNDLIPHPQPHPIPALLHISLPHSTVPPAPSCYSHFSENPVPLTRLFPGASPNFRFRCGEAPSSRKPSLTTSCVFSDSSSLPPSRE